MGLGPIRLLEFASMVEATGVDTQITSKLKDSKKRGRLSAEERHKLGKNAERNLHTRFTRQGFSFPIKPQPLHHDLGSDEWVTTHYISISEWLRALLVVAPEALFGQGMVENSKEQLFAWWSLYRQHHREHEVFQRHSDNLGSVLPLCVYGDEGRGPKRGNFLVWSVETPFGIEQRRDSSCDCATCLESLPEFEITSCNDVEPLPDGVMAIARRQTVNYTGHSYVTKHLLFGIPHWFYKRRGGKIVIHQNLQKIADDMTSLFEKGLLVNGALVRFSPVTFCVMRFVRLPLRHEVFCSLGWCEG